MAEWATPSGPEVVALVTAALVAWNTWRGSKDSKVVRDIHTLTNSAMLEQLKVNLEGAERTAVLARRIASITKEEGDVAARWPRAWWWSSGGPCTRTTWTGRRR